MTDLIVTDNTATPEYESLKQRFTHMEAQKNYFENAWHAAKISHSNDIERIGTALLEEAERRGWCDDYDKFVEELNQYLSKELEVRTRDYDIEVEYNVTVRRTINGKSYEDARDELKESVETDLERIDDLNISFNDATDYT